MHRYAISIDRRNCFQLQIINADLDEERDERLKRLTRKTVSTVNEGAKLEHGAHYSDDTKHMKAVDKIMRLITSVGMLIGIEFKYESCYWKRPGFYFAVLVKIATWSSLVNTSLIHLHSRDYARLLEPLALLGPSVTVR